MIISEFVGEKEVKIGTWTVVIDRPRGFVKRFKGTSIVYTYPVDYGYIVGAFNPDDGEEIDVFVGTAGPSGLHGRFMKGTDRSGVWQPDERKWFYGCRAAELSDVIEMFDKDCPQLVRGLVTLSAEQFVRNVGLAAEGGSDA